MLGIKQDIAQQKQVGQSPGSQPGIVKMLRCECDLADDGVLAPTALEAQQFDLVLMDCQIPRMDGYHAAAAI
jgi:CheY-like chemotaxis protein